MKVLVCVLALLSWHLTWWRFDFSYPNPKMQWHWCKPKPRLTDKQWQTCRGATEWGR